MNYIIKFGLVMVLLLTVVSCTSFETKDGLYEESEVVEDGIDIMEEEMVDILDDEVALGAFDLIVEGFDLSGFTEAADSFADQLYTDVEEELVDEEDYEMYLSMVQVPKNDLMAVVNVELEYLLQYDDGFWTERRSEYNNGKGYSVSSFQTIDNVYMYDITYNDNAGARRVLNIRYDTLQERYDYTSESYNSEGVLSYLVKQQFCRDDEGGYYYQAIRQGVSDGFERVSFSHFTDNGYVTYIRPATKVDFALGFSFNLYEDVPDDIDLLTLGFEQLESFSRSGSEFNYDID